MHRAVLFAGLAAALLAVGAIALYGFRPAPEPVPVLAGADASLSLPAPVALAPPAEPAPEPLVFGETALPENIREELEAVTGALGEGLGALVVHRRGSLAFRTGAEAEPAELSGVVRAVLSVLYGIAVDKGLVDPDVTLGALGVDEPGFPLSDLEETATLRDLLTGRSGVYLPPGVANLPERGSAPPGGRFHPTAWEANLLAALFPKATGTSIADALAHWIASPLGFEDFSPEHVSFMPDPGGSAYPILRLALSPRDLARIGTMMTGGGLWLGRRILSEDWVVASITPWSQSGGLPPPAGGYGYSWWINVETNGFLAESGDGLFIYADPGAAMALVLISTDGGGRAELLALVDILTRR